MLVIFYYRYSLYFEELTVTSRCLAYLLCITSYFYEKFLQENVFGFSF